MIKKYNSQDLSDMIIERLKQAEALIVSAAVDIHKVVNEYEIQKSTKCDWGVSEADKVMNGIIVTLCRMKDNIEWKDLYDAHGKYNRTTSCKVRKALGYTFP